MWPPRLFGAVGRASCSKASIGVIVLLTDFGLEGPYVGQIKAVLLRDAPGVAVIDLFSDLPAYDVKSAAYLLAAYSAGFAPGTVFLGVIDPGVGSDRRAAMVCADGHWFVGPDNGLFNVVAQRATRVEWWDIVWRPGRLSSSFHGRDVFAPVAAQLVTGNMPLAERIEPSARITCDWPEELWQAVYVDRFGNVITGIRAAAVDTTEALLINTRVVCYADTFSSVPLGAGFWYENSNGLIEIAVNQGRATDVYGLVPGDRISLSPGDADTLAEDRTK